MLYFLDQNFFYKRQEFGFIGFNRRVLSQSSNKQLPLLERLRFLFISIQNINEFFKVRLSILKDLEECSFFLKKKEKVFIFNYLLNIIYWTRDLLDRQINSFLIIKRLLVKDSVLLSAYGLDSRKRKFLLDYFKYCIFPKSYIFVLGTFELSRFVGFSDTIFLLSVYLKVISKNNHKFLFIISPSVLSNIRIIMNGRFFFISLCDIFKKGIYLIFRFAKYINFYYFSIVEKVKFLALKKYIFKLYLSLDFKNTFVFRSYISKMDISSFAPSFLSKVLCNYFNLNKKELFYRDALYFYSALFNSGKSNGKLNTLFQSFSPIIHREDRLRFSMFYLIKKQDIILYHPFESFSLVVRLIQHSVDDKFVVSIKQILYRTGFESIIVFYLIRAKILGKHITVFVELRAQSDERMNIVLGIRLQKIGINVVYGNFKSKTHVKLLIINRYENNCFIDYSHVSTGNYHIKTLKTYTDYSFITADRLIGLDLSVIFMRLVGIAVDIDLVKVIISPVLFKFYVLYKIYRTIKWTNIGVIGLIRIKANLLEDNEIIKCIYRASISGVAIQLIIRGVCCLVPVFGDEFSVIQVVSVLGRFLEHARIYCFHYKGKISLLISSADIAVKKLENRKEVSLLLDSNVLKRRIIQDSFVYNFQRLKSAWRLDCYGNYINSHFDILGLLGSQMVTLLELLNI